MIVLVGVGQSQDALLVVLAQHALGEGSPMGQIVVACHLGPHDAVVQLHDMGDERWDVVALREDEHQLQGALLRQRVQQRAQLVARTGIESDERVVHDEDSRFAEQRAHEFELPQLTAGEQDDVLIQQVFHREELIEVSLVFAPLGCVVARPHERLLQFRLYGRRLGVYLHLVPPLLQEVGAVVVAAVGITEGDILDIVAHQRLLAGCEVVFDGLRKHRMLACQHIDKHRLAAAVGSYDGDMLAWLQREVYGLRHRPFGILRYSFRESDNGFLHNGLLSDFRLVLIDEVLPSAIVGLALGASHLHEVAVGSTQGVAGVHELSHLLGVDMQHSLQHTRHLFLRCRPVAGDGHLDFHRCVFVDRYAVLDGGGDGYTLRPSQFEHRLHVLSEEGCFDGHLVGQVCIDDAGHAFEDMSQFQVGILELPQVDDAHAHHLGLGAHDAQHTVAHDVGARVDA